MWPPGTDHPVEKYGGSDLRLATLLFGDGVYSAGLVRGDEARNDVARELRRMRDAFRAVLEERGGERSELAEARIAGLEEQLRRIAAAAKDAAERRRSE